MTITPNPKTTITVYEPVAREAVQQDALAPRWETLDGKVIGLLDNTKDMVEVLLDEVKTLLTKDFPNAQFRHFRKESVSGAPPGLMEQVAACNAVITAVGDWGSCSSWSVRDSMALERKGIPTVTFVTDAFSTYARGLARMQNMEALPEVVIAHPIAARPADELREKVRQVHAQVKAALTVGS